jgi:hypothetical protein
VLDSEGLSHGTTFFNRVLDTALRAYSTSACFLDLMTLTPPLLPNFVGLSPHTALERQGHCHWHRWMTRTCLPKQSPCIGTFVDMTVRKRIVGPPVS